MNENTIKKIKQDVKELLWPMLLLALALATFAFAVIVSGTPRAAGEPSLPPNPYQSDPHVPNTFLNFCLGGATIWRIVCEGAPYADGSRWRQVYAASTFGSINRIECVLDYPDWGNPFAEPVLAPPGGCGGAV